jgi:hypothetical protein
MLYFSRRVGRVLDEGRRQRSVSDYGANHLVTANIMRGFDWDTNFTLTIPVLVICPS